MTRPEPGTLYEREGVTYQVQRVLLASQTITLMQPSGLGRPREVKWTELEARGYRPVRTRDHSWPG
jgi:hypothetical protein